MKQRVWVPAILLVLSVIIASRLSPHFLDFRYLLDTSTLYVETGLIALAMTLVIVSGNIDLSVGSMVALTACLTAKFMEGGLGTFPAIFAACGIGSVLGLTNGLLIAKLKIPSFLVTLGTMAAARGAAQAMLGSTSIKLPAGFKGLDQSLVAGFPWPFVIFLFLAAAFGLVLHRTVFGRWIFAVGTNESAAKYSCVPVDRVKVLVFVISGLMAGVAALLMDSRLAVARHDLARGMELDAITMAVVGGAAIRGGEGSILGTVLAMFLIMVIKSAMGVANVKPEYQLTAIGAILIAAVFVQNAGRLTRRAK